MAHSGAGRTTKEEPKDASSSIVARGEEQEQEKQDRNVTKDRGGGEVQNVKEDSDDGIEEKRNSVFQYGNEDGNEANMENGKDDGMMIKELPMVDKDLESLEPELRLEEDGDEKFQGKKHEGQLERSYNPPGDLPPEQPLSSQPPPPPYSIYTPSQRLLISLLCTCAGCLSPTAAQIYMPSIPTLAKSFNRTSEEINLTVTVYMVFQGITPTLWGSLSDEIGRRPIYLLCLLVFAAANIALSQIPTTAYWALMLFRCLSALGSAVTIALGYGVTADIAAPFERGKFMAIASLGPQLGPCVGPVLGGILASSLGWRSIFYFMFIASLLIFTIQLIFLPETLRKLVGNGSGNSIWDDDEDGNEENDLRGGGENGGGGGGGCGWKKGENDSGNGNLRLWNRSLWALVKRGRVKAKRLKESTAIRNNNRTGNKDGDEDDIKSRKISKKDKGRRRKSKEMPKVFGWKDMVSALPYFLEKDAAIILVFNGLNYSAYYAVITTFSTLLKKNYHLNDLEIGLAYLPQGLGAISATMITGRLLDRDFRLVKEKREREKDVEGRQNQIDMEEGRGEEMVSPNQEKGVDEIADDGEKKLDDQKLDIEEAIASSIEEKEKPNDTTLPPTSILRNKNHKNDDQPRPVPPPKDPNDLSDFPIEHARLRKMPWFLLLFWGSTILYGFLIQESVHLAAVLVATYFVGFAITNTMQTAQILLLDLFKGRGASVTANNNLCRCLLGAIGISAVDPMQNAIGAGPSLCIFIGLCAIISPLQVLEWKYGPKWRAERAERIRLREEKEQRRQ